MGRLKTLGPRLSTGAPRLGYATGDKAGRSKERDNAMSWRLWYRSPKWRALKKRVHRRDKYICQYEGTLCIGKHPSDNAPVAHHKIAHHGDPILFWDENNIVTTSKKYHDTVLQSQEKTQR